MDQGSDQLASTDVFYLLERLEEVLGSGSRLPIVSKTLVDDEECFAIIEQIHRSLPNEIRQARQIASQRDAVIEEAQAKAHQIIQRAQIDAEELVTEHYLARQAEAQAQDVLERAHDEAEQIRRDAYEWAYNALLDLDRRLDGLVGTVRDGLGVLRQNQSGAAPTPYEDEPADHAASGRWREE